MTTPVADLTALRRRYGVDFQITEGIVNAVDTRVLLTPMSVDRDELGALLATTFVAAGAEEPIRVVAEKAGEDSVQNDVERVHGLTLDALDRLHRFTRLWRATDWSVAELDLALASVVAGPLDAAALQRLADVVALHRRLAVPVQELCGLFSDLPRPPAPNGGGSLFDRLFNPPFFPVDSSLPNPGTLFVHPGLLPAPAPNPGNPVIQQRLLAGLGVDDGDLLELVTGLAGPLGLDPGANPPQLGFDLTVANLSLLYRHALLARLLQLTVPQLTQLARHATGGPDVSNLDDLRAVVALVDALRANGRTLDDAGMITGGVVLDASAYPDPAALADDIVAELTQQQALTFADTVFAFLTGLTEEHSRALVAANRTLVESVPGDGGRLRLAREFGPASPVTVPTGVPVTPESARDVLLRFHPSVVVPNRLAPRLGLAEDKLRGLLGIAGVNLADPALTDALRGTPTALVALIQTVRPFIVLFGALVFDAEAMAFVAAHRPLFALPTNGSLDGASIRQVDRYVAVLAPSDVEPPAAADVHAVLAAFTATGGFAAADQAALARVLRVESGVAASLRGLSLPPDALAALERLRTCAALARATGVGGDALLLAAASDYASLDRAADAVLAALRARHRDPAEFDAQLEPHEDRLRSRRRDALVAHLIHTVKPEFASRSDLYHHFLIDTQLEGCARTTRVAAAIASVQLYVHRVLMNLEQDGRDATDGSHVHIPPAAIPADEWAWRRNYRVWEANRKVFLFPENYLEPELRDDKTPQFEALESELLQKDVTDDNVLDAYASYLRGFDEVANLTIAGVYHDVNPAAPTDRLHLVGVTASDPPVYYYRTVTNAIYGQRTGARGVVWSPWRRIDVQISARRASPVVFRGRLHLFWTEFTTKPAVNLADGNSVFSGYQHTMVNRWTTLRPDGTWTAPQTLAHTPGSWGNNDLGVVHDPLDARRTPRFGTDQHHEPRESYTLRGPNWDTLYLAPSPNSTAMVTGPFLSLVGRNFITSSAADIYHREALSDLPNRGLGDPAPVLCARVDDDGARLYIGQTLHRWETNPNALAAMLLEEDRIDGFTREVADSRYKVGLYQEPLLKLAEGQRLTSVAGSTVDVVIQSGPDVLLVQGSARVDNRYAVQRMGSTLGETLNEKLFVAGLAGFLGTEHQLALAEAKLPVIPAMPWPGTPDSRPAVVNVPVGVDFRGSHGVYYRELFFHIPMLIANHLNARQRFEAAHRWYQYVFSPTADDPIRSDVQTVAAVGHADGRMLLFDVTTSGGLGYRDFEAGTWAAARSDVQRYVAGAGAFTGVAVAQAPDSTLHVCGVMADGSVWHTVRWPDGYWHPGFTEIRSITSNPGDVQSVACAVDSEGTAHICVGATWDGAGSVWYTNRRNNGTWYGPFVNVKIKTESDPGFVQRVACTVDRSDQLHICVVTRDGKLWHTLREKTDQWRYPFGNVRAVAGGDPGAVTAVSCATDTGNNVNLGVVTAGGGLSVTRRRPDGSWQPFAAVSPASGSPGAFTDVSCATAPDGGLHVVGVVAGCPWYTRRDAGAWRPFTRAGRNERDRNWRYREFRGLGLPTLRQILTDTGAIEVYRTDPFNPHAIARLRLSAYQKSTVMKTIDNLLDWGDDLFARGTTESVNEAALVYAMAADILGEPPTELGDCGVSAVEPRTYQTIAPHVSQASPFLIELETLLIASGDRTVEKQGTGLVMAPSTVDNTEGSPELFRGLQWKEPQPTVAAVSQGWSVARQLSPVFCVPANRELREYWARVDDRLYKLRNCLDLTGARREVAPFAPEIDPRLLVRAKAAGVSIEDALELPGGDLPPYRFEFLIDRARSHATTVAAFGAALLSALEKRDVEELTRLRTVHQQQMLTLTTQTRIAEIDAANDAIETLGRQRSAADYRKNYYLDLLRDGLNGAEATQLASRATASVLQGLAGTLDTLAGVGHLLPQLGSVMAMTYGGTQLGQSASSWSGVMRDAAGVAEAVGAAAGLVAGFDRRREGWWHQVDLAERDIAILEPQLDAATRRRDIAVRSLEIHERTIDQTQEVFEYYGGKFTNAGLYGHLATTLQRLHRDAYNGALATARLAEQAFRFERDDAAVPAVGVGAWSAGLAGLLAGERLTIDLMNLERRYFETNYRSLEIDQAFSLNQIDPAALVKLRQTGECTFRINELFFDLFYPGQYRRRIRGVRLTMPCITGPYVNVSATLTLTGSDIRPEPKLGAAHLKAVPRRRSVSVATSTAQADGGVFEMSFRDERYMPFEGQGAVSSWNLTLPKTFRQFDYQTINDVILTLSYTANHDESFRTAVERERATEQGAIHEYLKNNSLSRVFSFRQDFSATFHRLLHDPLGTAPDFSITANYLPPYLPPTGIRVTRALLALRTKDGTSPSGFALSVGGTPVSAFTADPLLGGLPTADLGTLFGSGLLGSRTVAVTSAGSLAPGSPAPGDPSPVDDAKLLDMFLYVEYRLS